MLIANEGKRAFYFSPIEMLPGKYGNDREEKRDAPGTQNHKKGPFWRPCSRIWKWLCGAEISIYRHHEQGPDWGIQRQKIYCEPSVAKIPRFINAINTLTFFIFTCQKASVSGCTPPRRLASKNIRQSNPPPPKRDKNILMASGPLYQFWRRK